MTRVVGVDLSLSATGVATASGDLVVVKPRGHGYARHVHVIDTVLEHALAHGVDLVVVEDFVRRSVGGFDAVEASVGLGVMLRSELARRRLPWVPVNPATLKVWAVGDGKAKKAAMMQAAYDAGQPVQDDNAADAYFLRTFGLAAAGPDWHEKPPASDVTLRRRYDAVQRLRSKLPDTIRP